MNEWMNANYFLSVPNIQTQGKSVAWDHKPTPWQMYEKYIGHQANQHYT